MSNKRMNWEKLLSTKRVSEFVGCDIVTIESNYIDPRSHFERDFDQITFSYPFRRLQDKTQVIPFPKFDFVHTRLTHSLEVASVGRSFGKMAAQLIFDELGSEKIKDLGICPSDIGALVAAACLAHDIGNPPFGHSGEDAISHYFKNVDSVFSDNYFENEDGIYFKLNNSDGYNPDNDKTEKKEIFLRKKRVNDLRNYEGNANGFRIISSNCDKGINPTAALLGAFSKYPKESYLEIDPNELKDKKDKPKSQTKYGFFQAERELFKQVAEELGLLRVEGIGENDIAYKRHPFAFLMEASDDIAYGMIDFEDGCRLGLIDFDKGYDTIMLRNKKNNIEYIEINKSPKQILTDIAKFDASFDNGKLNSYEDFKQAISYLRGKVINVLIHECFNVFRENYDKIMNGNFDRALIECINTDIISNLKLMQNLVRKYVYQYKPVLESEASGFEVIEHLIQSFAICSNICYSCNQEETAKDLKLRSLVPDEYQPKIEKNLESLTDVEKYDRVLTILDYITGMTDKYAIGLYKKIKGIEY